MPPAKKSKRLSKRLASAKDVASKKDNDTTPDKTRLRKRKLSDMLGPQWSKQDLERFYEAYRKYGKDWKKVAVAIRNRSVEMVEALYTMNKAYLSLPEGTASVVGLVAMMTDHYSVLGGSDSEPESKEDKGTSHKPPKRARVKPHNSPAKRSDSLVVDLLQFPSSASNQSLLRKKRSGSVPRAVGKRTPRFPVSRCYNKDERERFLSPIRQGLKQTDDDVAHEVALVLTEASQRGGSPQVSQTANRKREMPSSVKHRQILNTESETSAKRRRSEVDEGVFELSLGSTEANSGNQLDDIKEACSGTEDEQKLDTVVGYFEAEATDAKRARTSNRGPKKKSKTVLFEEDDGCAFDALQTLADLSLMQTTMDTDSALQIKDTKSETIDKNEISGNHAIRGVKTKKLYDSSDTPKGKEKTSQINSGTRKVRQKSSPFKVPLEETVTNSCLDVPQPVVANDEAKSLSKTKRAPAYTQPKQQKSVRTLECSSSSTEHGTQQNASVPSTVQGPITDPAKGGSKRKTETPKRLIDISQSSKKLTNCLSWIMARRWCAYEWFYSTIDYPWFARREFVEYLDHVGLSHIPRLTRVEWGVIRSSLGKPRRFSEQLLKEEKEKLNQYRESVRKHYSEVRNGTGEGLPTDLARPLSVGQRVIAIHPRTGEIHDGCILTVDHDRYRVQFNQPELGVEFVMISNGLEIRCTDVFFGASNEQRSKVIQGDWLPCGSSDINCMPLNPMENMPACLTRPNVNINSVFDNEVKMNGQLKERLVEENAKLVSCEKLENTEGFSDIPTAIMQTNCGLAASNSQGVTIRQNSQFSLGTQIQAKEVDVQTLAELTRALDKKEAVVAELRRMNDEIQENKNSSVKESESFKKQYAAVLLQLNEANDQVSSALYCLRQRNTYQGFSSGTLLKPIANTTDPNNFTSSFDQSREPGSHVSEIVESSRTKAQTMVGAAMQAMTSLNYKVESSDQMIEEVIDFVNNRLSANDFAMPATKSSTHSEPGPPATPLKPDPDAEKLPDQAETQIPSEIIERCVATLLMIQKCTERQFPPGEVAQVLDYAMTSLQPCSSTNLPIYGEIQKCMGIIRNQILALVPT
ncbi:hypothetical protein ACFE04_013259 [Oxalis oulophora]